MTQGAIRWSAAARALARILISLVISVASVAIARAADPVVSSASVPLSGTIFDPNTSGSVRLSGELYVVTRAVFSPSNVTITAYATLPADVSATDALGNTYIALGSANTSWVTRHINKSAFPIISGYTLIMRPRPARPDSAPSPPPSPPLSFVLLLQLNFTTTGDLIPTLSSATTYTPG